MERFHYHIQLNFKYHNLLSIVIITLININNISVTTTINNK